MNSVVTPPNHGLRSWLPPSGGNLFQAIKAQTKTAEDSGIKISRLSIGQPTGPALLSAREAAAKAVMSEAETMHEYQDNGSPGIPDFARRFVKCHLDTDLAPFADRLGYLPIPGIKPMLPLVPLACGADFARPIKVMTMTDPGYQTPAFWCKKIPGVDQTAIWLHPGNNFLFEEADIDRLGRGDLLMLNYPHNPSGKAASRAWWTKICAYASERGIRIWNDAAYAILAHNNVHCALADVAVEFPELSWAESYSSSKAGNFTGWRVGAVVGSSDFVGDLARIKGDADSGFNAFAAAGVLQAFEMDRVSIERAAAIYKERIKLLVECLQTWGMRLAVLPDAGFFTLWQLPGEAFGHKIQSADQFNQLMIQNGGIVGVHFHPYIRYAVTGDIERMLGDISATFQKAQVRY